MPALPPFPLLMSHALCLVNHTFFRAPTLPHEWDGPLWAWPSLRCISAQAQFFLTKPEFKGSITATVLSYLEGPISQHLSDWCACAWICRPYNKQGHRTSRERPEVHANFRCRFFFDRGIVAGSSVIVGCCVVPRHEIVVMWGLDGAVWDSRFTCILGVVSLRPSNWSLEGDTICHKVVRYLVQTPLRQKRHAESSACMVKSYRLDKDAGGPSLTTRATPSIQPNVQIVPVTVGGLTRGRKFAEQ